MLFRSLTIAAAAIFSTIGVQAAYSSKGPNVMYYWGQVCTLYLSKTQIVNFLLMFYL